MFFKNKNEKSRKCESCGSKSDKEYSFCPFCGSNFLSENKEEDLGLLGKDDFSNTLDNQFQQSFGITDKLISSIMNSMMKNLGKQFKEMEKDIDKTEIKNLPNGIRIKISSPYGTKQVSPQKKQIIQARTVDENQIKKMSSLPRAKAKTNVKRIGDKVFYELNTPGVSSPQDVFISKLESGYEVKVIGDKKIYVNNVPINLPLKKYSVMKNKLLVEFANQNQVNSNLDL